MAENSFWELGGNLRFDEDREETTPAQILFDRSTGERPFHTLDLLARRAGDVHPEDVTVKASPKRRRWAALLARRAD